MDNLNDWSGKPVDYLTQPVWELICFVLFFDFYDMLRWTIAHVERTQESKTTISNMAL